MKSVRELTEYAIDFFSLGMENAKEKDVSSEPNSNSKTVPWMETARSHFGLKEIKGPKHNQTIIGWAKEIGGWIENFYKTDEIPWCGLFLAHCMLANKIKITIKNPLGARNWNEFGFKTTPRFGAIMVFSRKGGGHVGFYVSEDATTYHILGGNQSDQVNIAKVAKSRFLGARWPNGYKTLHDRLEGTIVKKFSGKLSTNEA